MAFSGNAIGQVWTTGNAENGGFFDASIGAALLSPNDLACVAGSTTVTSAAGGFLAAHVGHHLLITAGTGFVPGSYPITARADTNTITLERSPTITGAAGSAGVGTVSAGFDYSRSTTSVAACTQDDAACAGGSTTLTSVLATFPADCVGNAIQLHAGTGTGIILGFYMVTARADANTVTLDRTPTNGVNALSAGHIRLGGAVTIQPTCGGAAKSDFLFDGAATGHVTAGMTFYLNGGVTHTTDSVINSAVPGTAMAPLRIVGFSSVPGDTPIGGQRPTIACGSNDITQQGFWFFVHVCFTGTASRVVVTHTSGLLYNCSVIQLSTTAGRAAVLTTTANAVLVACELSAPNAAGTRCITNTSASFLMIGCWLHGASIGFAASTTGTPTSMLDCVISGCGVGISITGVPAKHDWANNTFHNVGVGVALASAAPTAPLLSRNNLFANCGQAHNRGALMAGVERANNVYDCGAANTNRANDPTDTAYDPAFQGRTTFTDLACADHAGPPFEVTTATGNFVTAGIAVGEYVRIHGGSHWLDTCQRVTAVAANTLTFGAAADGVTVDPPDGTDATGGLAEWVTDYRLGAASLCRGAGEGLMAGYFSGLIGADSIVEQGAWQAGAGAGGVGGRPAVGLLGGELQCA